MIKQIVEKIIRIPQELLISDTTFMHLLKDTGYKINNKKISILDIKKELKGQNDIIEAWVQYSENKRVSKGFYITKGTNNKWIIGCLGKYRNPDLCKTYEDKLEACSVYIKLELDSTLDLIKNN